LEENLENFFKQTKNSLIADKKDKSFIVIHCNYEQGAES
jgi:hypothetical protein